MARAEREVRELRAKVGELVLELGRAWRRVVVPVLARSAPSRD